MAYQKRYRTVIPVPRDHPAQDDLLVWLTRESFDRAAANDACVLVDFIDGGEIAAADIPPKADKQLGRPAAEFIWRAFEGVGERPPSA